MTLGSRSDASLNLSFASMSPINDPSSLPTSTKSPFGTAKSGASVLAGLNIARGGAGSPLHEPTSRLFPKRTRELQSQTGLSPNIWGPPTSGTSTPLFEIPESPSQDGFPDLVPLTETGINSPARRGRAGTLPSRISPVGTINGVSMPSLVPKTSRPTPTSSPFRPGSTSAAESAFYNTSPNTSTATLLSRLRAGSMPQRASILGPSNVFNPSINNSAWNARSRAATLTSIQSSEELNSPPINAFGKDGINDSGVRTLDYLGLAEAPQQMRTEPSSHSSADIANQQGMSDLLTPFNLRNSNRFRSFSVNTQPKTASDGTDQAVAAYGGYGSGTLTPSAAAALEHEYELVQERVRLHNQAVQAYAINAKAARPRARTAGLVETPQRTSMRGYMQGAHLDHNGSPIDTHMLNGELDPSLVDSFQNITIVDHSHMPYEGFEDGDSQVSRSLWIGSIPASTTMSSLDAVFNRYGTIESTRVLTHKNCGFVNFENVENAVRARQLLNGKEIFPGSGPVRIGFAKAPTTTSNQNTMPPSPSAADKSGQILDGVNNVNRSADYQSGLNVEASMPLRQRLSEQQPELVQIALDFGAQQSDVAPVVNHIHNAATFPHHVREIPPIPEPNSDRLFDAPRLRDIRKRIDNGACSLQEIEQIAMDMLPEIAELSSDYLGNTVVQKLFEFSSEQTKEQMLGQVAPHLAEIGVHKNGTWAAQKIIEVCKTEQQTRLIVESVHPFTVPLFLDQFGNYVIQCCLRFGAPYNDFIFETMLGHLWEIAQGRFGARAMRACLESHHAPKYQQRLMAAAIVLHSVQLATNANGALLLTWLLDTCTFPHRRTVLAPRLVPHLVALCTHKVAYLTVLKVVNQRNEPEARDVILQSLFFTPGEASLEKILCDQTSGVTCIFKVLTSPFLDDNTRPQVVQTISQVLTRIKAAPNQGYKRLLDEVGLSSRPQQQPPSNYAAHPRPIPNDRSKAPAHVPNPNNQSPNFHRQFNNGFPNNVNNPAYDNSPSPVRAGSNEAYGFPNWPYPQPQPRYQPMPTQSPYMNFVGGPPPRSNGSFSPNGFNAYNPPQPPVDPFRTMPNHPTSPLPYQSQMSPVMGPAGFAQGYPQPGNMIPFSQPQYFFSPPMQAVPAAGRRRGR